MNEYAVDLHTHTRFFHGRRRLGELFDPVGFRLLAAFARSRGMDGVAVTNHDYHRRFEAAGLAVIPGIEVSTTQGHVLVVGPDPPAETAAGTITPEETVELAHERGCAAVIAHPYRDSTVRDVDADFDAVEVNGKRTRTHPWVVALAKRRGLPITGGSDAHFPFEVARAHAVVEAPELTPSAVAEAIRDNRVRARVDRNWFQRGLRRLYRSVHGYRGVDPGAENPDAVADVADYDPDTGTGWGTGTGTGAGVDPGRGRTRPGDDD